MKHGLNSPSEQAMLVLDRINSETDYSSVDRILIADAVRLVMTAALQSPESQLREWVETALDQSPRPDRVSRYALTYAQHAQWLIVHKTLVTDEEYFEASFVEYNIQSH